MLRSGAFSDVGEVGDGDFDRFLEEDIVTVKIWSLRRVQTITSLGVSGG